MNKNLVIGGLVILVILVAGYFLLYKSPSTENYPAATSTSPTSETTATNTPNPPPPPPAPQQASAPVVQTDAGAAPSNSTAVVTGHVTPDGAPTTCWYEYGQSTSLGTRTAAQSIGSGFTAISAPGYITGLRANTTYYFRLSAKNRFATVNGTTYSFSTNNNPPQPAVAPAARSLAATDITRTTANLNGQVNPNGSFTTYWFEYGQDTDLGNVSAFQSAGNGSASVPISASVSDLKPLTKYFFRVNAQNVYGTVVGSILSFTTGGPAAPGQPSVNTGAANQVTASSAKLNGRVDPNGGETTYWFEYSKDSLLGSILGSTSPVQTLSGGTASVNVSADVTTLDSNTKYFYRLVASNQYGTVRGGTASFKTKP